MCSLGYLLLVVAVSGLEFLLEERAPIVVRVLALVVGKARSGERSTWNEPRPESQIIVFSQPQSECRLEGFCLDLLCEEIALVEEQNHRRLAKPARVANLLEQVQCFRLKAKMNSVPMKSIS